MVGKVVNIYQDIAPGERDRDTLNISATGEIDAAPDIAQASFAVMTDGKDPKVIQDDNTKKMNEITSFLKSQGIADEDIATQNYNLYPRYNYDNGKQTLDGYTINQSLYVKIRDLDAVGDMISGVIDRGANTVNSLSFGIEDPEDLRQQARLQALENAKVKARELADTAGVKLGKVVSFSENSLSYPMPMMYEDRAYGYGGGAAESYSPDIQPGQTTITASVVVTFELK